MRSIISVAHLLKHANFDGGEGFSPHEEEIYIYSSSSSEGVEMFISKRKLIERKSCS